MKRQVVVLPEAELELIQAMRWYDSERPGLDLEFLGEIERVLARIAEAPENFAVWPDDARYQRATLDRFPYVVLFEDRPEGIEVVSVSHGRRRPGYWTGRSRP